jgi:transglutaminase-like putative cysteine protease
MRTFRVVHTTEYRYDAPVSASYGEAHLIPRRTPHQTCRTARVDIDPRPLDQRERRDYFGNRALYFAILEEHTHLVVRSESEVETAGSGTLPLLADQPWNVARDRVRAGHDGELAASREFALDSPLVPSLRVLTEYAEPSFPPGRPLVEAVVDLSHRVKADFAYEPGSTTVGTTVVDVMARRAGVCQDFAHVVVGCLRAMGLAARYVSGYLDTRTRAGRGSDDAGADASHAWAAVLVPGAGWLDVDPTNDHLVHDGYVTTGWGRDYGDVPPLKGVIYTEGAHELSVTVDVTELPTGDA